MSTLTRLEQLPNILGVRESQEDRREALLTRIVTAARKPEIERLLKGAPGRITAQSSERPAMQSAAGLRARLGSFGMDDDATLPHLAPNRALAVLRLLRGIEAETRPIWRWRYLLPVTWLVLLVLFLNLWVPRLHLSPGASFYVVQPLSWLSLCLVTGIIWLSSGRPFMLSNKSVMLAGLLMGGVTVAVMVLVGVIFSFGQSPYSHQWVFMLGNLFYAESVILSIEVVRGFLTTVIGRGRPIRALAIPTLLLALAPVSFNQFSAFAGLPSGIEFSGSNLIPALAENLLASFLALSGGPAASFAYRGVIEAFEWLSPVLPSPDWMVTAFVGILIPVLGLVTIQGLFAPKADHAPMRREAQKDVSSALRWVFLGAVGVFLIWFNFGVFGYTPSVLSGPSMIPTLWAGDIVIAKEMPAEEIAVGDIIRYQQDGRYVMHRVIAIENDGDEITFTTQGDNVNSPDAPVTEAQFYGKVILVIPKIGYVSVWARQAVEYLSTLAQ